MMLFAASPARAESGSSNIHLDLGAIFRPTAAL
jgi:hypothetical protein